MKKNKLYTVNKYNKHGFMFQGLNDKPENLYGFGSAFMKASGLGNLKSMFSAEGIGNSLGQFVGNMFGTSTYEGVSANPETESTTEEPVEKAFGGPVYRTPKGNLHFLGGITGGLASAVGGAIGGAISNGYSSTAGSVVDKVGDLVGNIPGFGTIAGAGLKVLSGGINALFGTKVDQAKLKAANAGTAAYNKFTSNAKNFDAIKTATAQANVQNAYSGGLFNRGAAARKNEELKKARAEARSWADRSVGNNIANLVSDQNNNALANFSAFGGSIDLDPSTAIGYSLYTDKYIKDMHKDSSGISNLFAGTPDIFGFGGGIYSNGAAFNNGVSYINSGGTHEENPYDGVQMGTDGEGVPNLVEEGEVVWNDYVFSNRLIVPRGKRGNYGKRARKYAEGGELSKGSKVDIPYESKVLRPYEGYTFADAAKKIIKKNGADEVNDPITLRGIDAELSVLASVQEKERQVYQLREMEEAIDNMSPEEFAMLQQQMESQQIAQQQQEEALRQQQMIPQGMEQMVPAEQMAAAYGGPIYGLGGLLNNWDNTKQAANKFDTGGFKKWWKDNVNSLENTLHSKGETIDYGKIYRDITGEEGPTESQDVYNALEALYNQDASKFGEYTYRAETPNESIEAVESPITTEGEEPAEIIESSIETEIPAKDNIEETLGDAEREALDYYNSKHPNKQKTIKDWKALSNKSREGIISDYRKSIKGKDNKVAYDNRLAQQRAQEQVIDWQNKQTNSNLTADDIKNLSYEDKVRLAKYMNPEYQAKDLSKLTLNEREEAGKELDEQLVKLSKDNNITIGDISNNFTTPTYHRDWKPVDAEQAWQENTTGYNWQNPLYGGEHDVVAGNTEGKYQPRSWVNDEGKVVIKDGDNSYTYDDLKAYELSDEYLKPRYELAKSAAAKDEAGQKIWNDYVNGLSQDYTTSYTPTTVFGEKYADNLESYDTFKKYITSNYDTLNDAGSGFFDQKAGQMHGMMLPTTSKQRELYQIKGNEGTYLSPEGDWQDYYTDTVTDDGKGTILHTLDPKGGISFDRMTSLPEGVKQNEDGTYSSTGSNTGTDNDPFPKPAEWPYLAGIGLQAGSLAYNLLSPKDYSNADAMIKAAQNAGTYNPIEFRPIGNYLTYRPMDIWFEQNRMDANARATDRAIMNNAAPSGTKMAGLLASGYNNQIADGELYRKALEYNDALRKQVEEFNKDTDKFNSEGFLKADMSNQDAATRSRGYTLEGLKSGYAMRQAIDDAKTNAINAGLSGLANLAFAYGQNKYNQELLGWGMRHNAEGPGVYMRGSKPKTEAKGGRVRRKKGIGF